MCVHAYVYTCIQTYMDTYQKLPASGNNPVLSSPDSFDLVKYSPVQANNFDYLIGTQMNNV